MFWVYRKNEYFMGTKIFTVILGVTSNMIIFGAVSKIKYFLGLEHFWVGLYPGSLNSIEFLEH